MEKEVLIIDENQGSDGLEQFLSTKDYAPILVDNVDEGLENIKGSENLKVVLLNVELSGKSGSEALTEIKDAYPDIIVIVIRAGANMAREVVKAHGGTKKKPRKNWIRNIYRRAPYLYANHAEAAEALGKDVRTFEERWPKEKEFPNDHTLLVG